MSDFLTDLANILQQNQVMTAMEFTVTHFGQASQPVYVLHQYLTSLSASHNKNIPLIQFLIDAFGQWEHLFASAIPIEMFDENLFLFALPPCVLRDFCNLFQITKDYLLYLLRTILNHSIHSPEYKRLLVIIVTFDYQFEFYASEILVPLIVNVKDQLIHIYLNQKVALQEFLLDLLNHLYENGGQRFRYILTQEFGVRQNNINKKAIKKLAVRFWNSFGNGQIVRYPHLASLQDRSTLGYLIGMKYNAIPDENTMSNEAWNEAVDEVVRGNTELSHYLLELLVERDDAVSVNYWLRQLSLLPRTLPSSISNYVQMNREQRSIVTANNNNPAKQSNRIYHQLSLNDVQIHFVDSIPGYERLLDRLFNVHHPDEELTIGFDCEWKPIFKNLATAKQRISIMQIAFPREIFLLDLLHFFHTYDGQELQERLGDRLFDDDHLTVICYGFRSDASMLTSSYPIFSRALLSGKTLLDLGMVHTELNQNQPDIFPYALTDKKSPLKEKGLSELVRLCFGHGLDKSEQCSNWERRPLREAQTLYAAMDAYCLLELNDFLRDQLQQSPNYLLSFRGKKPEKIAPKTKSSSTNDKESSPTASSDTPSQETI